MTATPAAASAAAVPGPEMCCACSMRCGGRRPRCALLAPQLLLPSVLPPLPLPLRLPLQGALQLASSSAKMESTSSTARSPIACTATCKPASRE